MTAIFYTGRDKHGVAHGGQATVDSVTEFVQSRFRSGWQHLIVADNDKRDHRLGQIVSADMAPEGKRTWWAELAPVGAS